MSNYHLDNNYKRVLLLTDSLGCPRRETNVNITWTDRVMQKMKDSEFIFYTYCMHGLHFKKIPVEYIYEINPEIIILQVGVVDACRRTMHLLTDKIISKIRGINTIIHFFRKKYHYRWTKLVNIHYSSLQDVEEMCIKLLKIKNVKICIIPIAPASSKMKKNTYNFENDVNAYNSIFYKLEANSDGRVICVNPYFESKCDDIFLEDGHHLNAIGLDLVYKEIIEYLEKHK